ncbi:MAG: hypothetical protein WAW31_13230 [Smithella sp.]
MMKYWTKFFPASASANNTIKSYKVIGQKNDTDSVNVKINACVDPFSAREAVYRLGLNNSIAVFIPARKPGGNTSNLRSIMYKFLSNLIVIGKVDYTISMKKKENTSHVSSMLFNNVTVRLTYRIIAKNNKSGNMEILTTGTEEAKGVATGVEEKQMGDFTVSYPENIIYLANSIEQKSDLKVLNFSPSSIVLEYQN